MQLNGRIKVLKKCTIGRPINFAEGRGYRFEAVDKTARLGKMQTSLYRGRGPQGKSFRFELRSIFNLTFPRTSSYFNHFRIRGCRSNGRYISNIGSAGEKPWLKESFMLPGYRGREAASCNRDQPASTKCEYTSIQCLHIFSHWYRVDTWYKKGRRKKNIPEISIEMDFSM